MSHTTLAHQVHAEIAAVLDLMPQDVQPDADLRENYGLTPSERTALRVAIGVTFKVFPPILDDARIAGVDLTQLAQKEPR